MRFEARGHVRGLTPEMTPGSSLAPRDADAPAGRQATHGTRCDHPGMPVYISLMKWTSQGIGGMPAWRNRMEDAERVIEERGGTLIGAYVTLGRYDLVEVFEAPDDETAYQCIVAVARHGSVTTETLRAFTREEADRLIKSL